jgi:hypothetical protein
MRGVTTALVALVFSSIHSINTNAAENATGFYLLGSKSSMAGYVPPPGIYVVDINYAYSGSASGSAARGIALRRTGVITIEADVTVDAGAYINAPLATWITPEKVFGGNVGFGIMLPWGWKGIDADLYTRTSVTLPDQTIIGPGRHFKIEDDSTKFGDPVLAALIGWHEGNWHWNFSTLVNVPIGPWDEKSISNIAFHRWGLDTSGALTYLDPSKGFEVSVAAGFTFNWENPDTDYKTGTEFHIEWGLTQHFSKTFSLGLAGYHYQQITGDSGSGARLGDFEGRVTALGPVMTYGFSLGKLPINTEWKYLREFNAKNRLEGNVGLLTVSMPLWVPGH